MRKLLNLLVIHLLSSPLYAQTDLLGSQQKWVKELVTKKHIAPRTIDDQFAAGFYRSFLHTLDGSHLFLTLTDLRKLEGFRNTIDEEWNNGTTNFFTTAAQLYKARVQAAKTLVTDICAKPFDYSLPEVYNFSDTSASATDKALHNRWYTMLKAEVLRSLMTVAFNQWQTKNTIVKAEILAKEPEIRARVKTKHLNQLNNYLQSDADFHRQLRPGKILKQG